MLISESLKLILESKPKNWDYYKKTGEERIDWIKEFTSISPTKIARFKVSFSLKYLSYAKLKAINDSLNIFFAFLKQN